VAERETRALAATGWWSGTPPQQRYNLIASRMLSLSDGSWWVFGAWGRWYRWSPRSGQWHLCPPPQLTITRRSARPLQPGMPAPQAPPHIMPSGPDLAYDPPTPVAFVQSGLRPEITSRVRATVESAAALPVPDYPHWWQVFSSTTPSTVVVTWGVMLWCAVAPVFDSRLDQQLLDLWSPYRSRRLPDIDGPRWLTPPPLEVLVGLYAERLRAGRVDSAVVILRTMWAMAGALREDPRFQERADALIAMLGVTLANPTVDYGVLPYGDAALVQQWLTRCPPGLAPALRLEASAGEHFRNAYYDLADALTPIAGDHSQPGYLEPRILSATLLAADLAIVRPEVAAQVIGWLDPEVSALMQAMLVRRDHPLHRMWPEGDRLPSSLRERIEEAEPSVRDTLLARMYAADLAWCRLGGGIPARPRGFPVPVAILAEIIGPKRAIAGARDEPGTPLPGIAPLAQQYPPNPNAVDPPSIPPSAHRPPTGPPGQAPSWSVPGVVSPASAPATEAWVGPGAPSEGSQSVSGGSVGGVPPATEAWAGPGVPSGESRPGPGMPPPRTEAWPGTSGPGPSAPYPPPVAGTAGPAVPSPAGPVPRTEAWSGENARPPQAPRTQLDVGASKTPAPEAASGEEDRALPPPAGFEIDAGVPDDDEGWNADTPARDNAAAREPGHGATDDSGGPTVEHVEERPGEDAIARDDDAGVPDGADGADAAEPGDAIVAQPGDPAVPAADGPADPGSEAGADSDRDDATVPDQADPGVVDLGHVGPLDADDTAEPILEHPAVADAEDGVPSSGAGSARDDVAMVVREGVTVADAEVAPGEDPVRDAAEEPVRDDMTVVDLDDAAQDPVRDDATVQDDALLTAAGDATFLDTAAPPEAPFPQATFIDRMHGTRADSGGIPVVAPTPVPPVPPRTKAFDWNTAAERPQTRALSQSMADDLFGAPMPERPVEQIEPPPVPAPMPAVVERFGIRFVSGADDAAALLDGTRQRVLDGGSRDAHGYALLIVGASRSGQRRITRLVARALASAGAGDGSVRTTDPGELRGERADAVEEILRRGGPPLLFERFDEAILSTADPERVAAAVTRVRGNGNGGTALIATCDPDTYTRLASRFPEVTRLFQVFRLPDFADVEARLALLQVLADERRVTIGVAALDVVRADLGRMGGRGDLVGARLVEAYLERAVARQTQRSGVSHDRLVLAREDFTGVAEEIEPSLRPPRDVDGFLRTLNEMIGLDEVKRTINGLVAEARMAAERSMRGLPPGNPSRHLIFLGRPGTGKLTVAGLVGGVYAALNLLDSGHLVVCDARSFAGNDAAAVVRAQVERATGGVLVIEDAYLLARMRAAQSELVRCMEQRRDKFLIICAGPPDEMDVLLLTDPGFRAGFGAIVEFAEPTDRQLVQLFTRLAERDLYLLDEELRVELLGRFTEMRRSPDFAFADTVRRLFEQTVSRQAARLAGGRVDAAAVARLSARDLPEF
jgi:hypothetical protein